MKIASWNVNSLKVRLPHLLTWLDSARPDALCLQETKLEDHNFPAEALREAGYHAVFTGQKTYNGVAILGRSMPADVHCGLPALADPQQRLIAATVDGVRIVCAYMPNGQAPGSEKFAYKLAWLDAMAHWLTDEIRRFPSLALCGDFNIAPDDRDVHDPAAWAGQILCTDEERQAFRRFCTLGLHDSFRLFEQPEKSFSWWDYRQLGFQKNQGVRIDHILLTPPLAACCTAAGIDRAPRKWERPSDHAPVWAECTPPVPTGEN